jgi:hypothetical protein
MRRVDIFSGLPRMQSLKKPGEEYLPPHDRKGAYMAEANLESAYGIG